MTEKDAIKIIKEEKSWESDNRKIDAFILAIDALEEIKTYRELEKKLNGVDLVMLATHWMEMAAEGEVKGYQRGRVLTNEDADQWDAYKEIGTPEECRAAVEKQKAKKPIPIDYEKYMDTVINAQFLRGAYWCPNCRRVVKSDTHCNDCGQKLDWSDEE